jgi:endonuclease/exonuclease/phosphatase family metal-dependent hydrolase
VTGFSMATWNVHAWVGRDGRRDPSRAFRVIAAIDADVVALQEVEGRDWPAAAEQLGYRPLLAPTRQERGMPFGNALLVRAPVLSLDRIDLTVAGREPRGALDATVQLGEEVVRIVATHLGLGRAERRSQAAALAARILERQADLATALLGDLNDWTRRARQLGALEHAVAPLSRVSTFPSRRPLLPLDRVTIGGGRFRLQASTVSSPVARMASDHLPLLGVCSRPPDLHSAP